MSLTVVRPLPAFLLILALAATPAGAAGSQSNISKPAKSQARKLTTAERLSLYSPRVRRSTVTYLRLRLLELREEGLDRARAAIERRLSVDDLIRGPRPPQP